ncbi:MAG: hypothetical protein U0174_02325 [Polyangiaceae bacterium]
MKLAQPPSLALVVRRRRAIRSNVNTAGPGLPTCTHSCMNTDQTDPPPPPQAPDYAPFRLATMRS